MTTTSPHHTGLRRRSVAGLALALAAVTLGGAPAVAAPPPSAAATPAAPKPAATKAAAAGVAPVICSLEQCTQRALAASPFMAAATATLDSYRALLRSADAARYPRFDITGFFAPLPEKKPGAGGGNWLEDWDWTKLSPLVTAQLSFTQVLWTFGKIDALRAAARSGVQVGRATRQVATMELSYQVARAWWGLVIAKELAQIIDKGVKELAKERARLEAERDKAEDEDKPFDATSLLRLRMAEADLETRVRQARRAKLLSEDALRAALALPRGTPVRAKAKYIEALPLQVLPIAAYERLAVENHPRLLAMRNGAVARLKQLRYQKLRLLPDIVLTGRLAYTYAPSVTSGNESLADNPTNPTQSGAGIGLRWRLDVFGQLARIDRARAEHRKATGLAAGEAQKVRLAVRNLVRELKDQQALIPVYERAMKAARGWLTSESEMSKGGFTEYKEVVRALEQYYRRRLAWLESIYAFNVKVAELSRAVGVDITAVKTPRRTKAKRGAAATKAGAEQPPQRALDGGATAKP